MPWKTAAVRKQPAPTGLGGRIVPVPACPLGHSLIGLLPVPCKQVVGGRGIPIPILPPKAYAIVHAPTGHPGAIATAIAPVPPVCSSSG
jgi:hypothetical protein